MRVALLSLLLLPALADAQPCFPQCRSGFLCHEARCISRCNPVCEAGRVCGDDGECRAPADASSRPSERTEPPSAYRHDGFYLRLGLGVGYGAHRLWAKGSDNALKVSGRTEPAFDFAIGGTFSNGVVLAYEMGSVVQPQGDGRETRLTRAGAQLAYYPDPTAGLYGTASFGAFMGDSSQHDDIEEYAPERAEESAQAGYSVAGGLGYDAFVSEQSSFGLAARVILLRDAQDTTGIHYDATMMMLHGYWLIH